jgi:hypothetical protein
MEGLGEENTKFNKELEQQIGGRLNEPEKHFYKLGYPGKILLSVGMPNLPIELKASKLNEKANNPEHQYEISKAKDLPKHINNPLAIFSYGDKTKAINVITEMQYKGKNFLVGISLSPVVNGKKLKSNNIRNVFPKDTLEWINWINQGKGLYFQKEKVLNLLDQQRINPADVAFGLPEKQVQQGGSKPKLSISEADLNSAINIVKIF